MSKFRNLLPGHRHFPTLAVMWFTITVVISYVGVVYDVPALRIMAGASNVVFVAFVMLF